MALLRKGKWATQEFDRETAALSAICVKFYAFAV